ncbi:RNA recognition domain-containing protein [Apiospora arundinis]
MTDKLPPQLLALFAPRPPLRWVEHADKAPQERKTATISGLADYLPALNAYKDQDDYTPTESWLEMRDRKKLEKKAAQESLQKEVPVSYKPAEDPNIRGDPFKTLIVARLSYDANESDLEREFGRFGPIERIRIIADTHAHEKPNKKKKSHRGYAFVVFEREKDMRAALDGCDGIRIKDRRIKVDVERGRTVKGWKPRRFGGGLGGRGYTKSAPPRPTGPGQFGGGGGFGGRDGFRGGGFGGGRGGRGGGFRGGDRGFRGGGGGGFGGGRDRGFGQQNGFGAPLTLLQVLATAAAAVATEIETVVTETETVPAVGMTEAVAAHMMTDLADATEVDSVAIATDEAAAAIVAAVIAAAALMPTTNPSEAAENIATTTDPERTTTGNVGMREATKILASCAATNIEAICASSRLASMVGIFCLQVTYYASTTIYCCLSFSLLSPRVSEGKRNEHLPHQYNTSFCSRILALPTIRR